MGKTTAFNVTGRIPYAYDITIPANSGPGQTLWDLIQELSMGEPPFRPDSAFGWQIRALNTDGSDRAALNYGTSPTVMPVYVALAEEETSPTYQLDKIYIRSADASTHSITLVVFA